LARRRRALTEAALPLKRDDVSALSRRLEEPEWLLEKRLAAWDTYESIPMPDSSKDEPWRRTDLGQVDWETLTHLTGAPNTTLDDVPDELIKPLIGAKQGGLIVFGDGNPVHIEVAPELTAQGVIFSTLSDAWVTHRELVEEHFMTRGVAVGEGKFSALHAAIWTHGVFLYVPKGKVIDLPLHSIEYVTGTETTSTHILAVVGDGASVTYLHESSSPANSDPLVHFGVTELFAGENADFRYIALQNWADNAINLGHQRGRVARHGRLDWVAGEMGTAFEKIFMTLDLDDNDSWGRISGLYFADGDQHIDLDTEQNHRKDALRTTSDLLFKGALKDTARAVWQGMIRVEEGAQQTDGFQANRNLVLERSARADSIPGLEINADDVACTHASTIGKVDETEIFYLMSRGIPRHEAMKLIVQGFFDPVMERIPYEEIQVRLNNDILARLDTL